MEIKATVIDINKIFEKVSYLEDIDKDKVIRQGLRDGANLIIRSGKQLLSNRLKGTGKGGLMKTFVAKLKRQKLGALAGFNQSGHHSHLVDRGTKRRTTESGKNTGKMPANHFWSDAINTNSGQALAIVYKGIDRAINKIMSRN